MSSTPTQRRKLIEVALPLDAINSASVRESYIYRGNPSSLHKWWAQRPLAAARAVIFAQMVDDPSARPELFPTEEAQEAERQRLFGIIEELVAWENTNNEALLERAREEIRKSWRRTCAENSDHPHATELFNPDRLPAFHDPFAGGGTLPLEAQRLGLETFASDLNPIAVLINKAMIEIPPKFADRPPVNRAAREQRTLLAREWKGAQGLADDVRHYGQWVRGEVERRVGALYPKIKITPDLVRERPDLRPYLGRDLTAIAWLWARTVKSPNPAFADVDVPLASTFMLSTKTGREAYLEPVMENGGYRLVVRTGKPKSPSARKGTKIGNRATFECLLSGTPIPGDYIKREGRAGRMGAMMTAVVLDGDNQRLYLTPREEDLVRARDITAEWEPDGRIAEDTRAFTPTAYGLTEWKHLFLPRQTATLCALFDLVAEVRGVIEDDAQKAEWLGDTASASSYADAVATYLAFSIDKHLAYGNSLVPWYTKEDRPSWIFGQQVIPMVWDFTEVNPLSDIGGGFSKSVAIVADALTGLPQRTAPSQAFQRSATEPGTMGSVLLSTDPPYYDNVPYADLSDFFYVWLRHALRDVYPDLLSTLLTPKVEELVAAPYRHGGQEAAETFFLTGMTQAMHQMALRAHPAYPVTLYYAFKQSETRSRGAGSTGWETFLEAVLAAGFAIGGTWPMRTERSGRLRDAGSNALASSIVLVCRPRSAGAIAASRRDLVDALRSELPRAVLHLQRGNIAPVDLAQAAIGPGMAIFTRYARVIDASGNPLSVRDALALINETLDEVLAEQEGDFDADTRWAVVWFDQKGFDAGAFGEADVLARAKNTSVAGMVEAGIVASRAGTVRLLRPEELPVDWDPVGDPRLTVWEVVHHMVRALESDGETAAGVLMAKLGRSAEVARELAYRLYTICERRKRASEALSYNGLVQSWPEIARLAGEAKTTVPEQGALFGE